MFLAYEGIFLSAGMEKGIKKGGKDGEQGHIVDDDTFIKIFSVSFNS